MVGFGLGNVNNTRKIVFESDRKKIKSRWHCIECNKIRRKAFFTLLNYVRLRWRHTFQLLSIVTKSIWFHLYVVVRRVSSCLPKPFMVLLLSSSYCHRCRHHSPYMQGKSNEMPSLWSTAWAGAALLCLRSRQSTLTHSHTSFYQFDV